MDPTKPTYRKIYRENLKKFLGSFRGELRQTKKTPYLRVFFLLLIAVG
jgi:hypothetical protein